VWPSTAARRAVAPLSRGHRWVSHLLPGVRARESSAQAESRPSVATSATATTGSGAAVWTRLRHPPPKTSTTRAKTRRAAASAQHRRTRPRLFPRREARARVSRFRRGSPNAETLLWLLAPLPRKRADTGGRGSTTCPPVAAGGAPRDKGRLEPRQKTCQASWSSTTRSRRGMPDAGSPMLKRGRCSRWDARVLATSLSCPSQGELTLRALSFRISNHYMMSIEFSLH
jgi:hypothetical protein